MTAEEVEGVTLSHLDDPLGDDLGVSKRDLLDHLLAHADRMLPLLADRALSVVRVRPGSAPFMQKNAPKGAPEWLRTEAVWSPGSKRTVHFVVCDDVRTLVWLANQRAVEFHVPMGRISDEEPTTLLLDLDPPEGADFSAVVAVARLVRQALADAGLAGAVKTSGSKGVHVVVPVTGSGYADVAAATRALAGRVAALDPSIATVAYLKEEREGRVFVDSTRSGGGTVAAAYSPRARPGLPVSTPLSWDELGDVVPADLTIATVAGRGDPWATELPDAQRLPADVVAEGHEIPVARVAAMHEGKRRKKAARDAG